MKKTILLMVGSFVLFTLLPNTLKAQDKWDGESVSTHFYGGTGTKSDPFIIRTGAECAYFLKQIQNGMTFEGQYVRLDNDVILGYYIGYNVHRNQPGTFAGIFDGNKHFLSDMRGYFIGTLSGCIHDLKIGGNEAMVETNTGHMYNCYVSTWISSYSGGLAALAVNNSGIIEDCYATGHISGRGEYGFGYQIAALVYNNSGTLQNCASEVVVFNYGGGNDSGQMTYTNTGTVTNCIQGTNNITTMFDFTGTTCTIEYIDTLHFVDIDSKTVTKGQAIGVLPNPYYDWTFVGWYRNGELVKETDKVYNNWTLFAKWEQRIRKQPTIDDLSVIVDDRQHATITWYKSTSKPTLFADWQSTNHSRNTTSSQTYIFDNCEDRTLSFHYDVSSESADRFKATLNGTVLVDTGGEHSETYSYVIPDNGQYALTLSYSKDDSENEGEDMVRVSEIMLSPAPQLIANDVTSIQVDPTIKAVYYCTIYYSNTGITLTSDYVQITPTFTLTYIVDGIIYKSYDIEEDASITPEVAPTKDGYTFSGWSEIPGTMPAHDVIVTGSFTKYNLKYVDASTDVETSRFLSYDDPKNNSVTLLDAYKAITITENIPLKQISYVRNFANTNWQSLYVPFEIPLTEVLLEEFDFAYINGAKLYDRDDDGTAEDLVIEVFKVKSGTLRANMPYLIRAKTTGSKTITVNEATLYATEENSIDCSTTTLKFTFTGGYETLGYDDIGGCYLLGGGTWNEVKEGGTMKPMRFYLRIDSRDYQPFKAPVIRMTVFGEDDELTEIQSPLLQEGAGEAPVFDLQGRRVEYPENGIYIINGKKVIVK